MAVLVRFTSPTAQTTDYILPSSVPSSAAKVGEMRREKGSPEESELEGNERKSGILAEPFLF